MTTFWKVFVGLLLTLPVGAYVAGTLISSQASPPAERAPIVVTGESNPDRGGSDASTPRTAPRPTDDPTGTADDDPDWDDVEDVVPEPEDIDDRGGNRGDDDAHDDKDDKEDRGSGDGDDRDDPDDRGPGDDDD